MPPPTSGPPEILIKSPTPNELVKPGVPKELTGEGHDPDGKSPINYEWILIDGPNEQVIGTAQGYDGQQTPIRYWIPQVAGSCGPEPVKIELRAADADGEKNEAAIDVSIDHGVC